MSAEAIAEETKKVRRRKSNRGRAVSEADRKRVAAGDECGGAIAD